MLTQSLAPLFTILAMGLFVIAGCQQSTTTESTRNPETAIEDEYDPWIMQDSGVTVSLRGICAVSDDVCWASGAQGTVLRTTDGGESWSSLGPKDYTEADFRDVHAWDDQRAIIMSAGDPDLLLLTEDGGASWTRVYEHSDNRAFFDGMVFDRDGQKGWLMGDPVDGRMFLMSSADRGKSWQMMDEDACPMLPEGIAGFAASGTNLCLAGTDRLIVGLGGESSANAGSSTAPIAIIDLVKGSSKIVSTPMAASSTSGVFSVCSLDVTGQHLVAVGGDYEQVNSIIGNCSISMDGGETWTTGSGDSPDGFRSAVLAIPLEGGDELLITTGPQGTDLSRDGGNSWYHASATGFHTISFGTSASNLWGAGSGGRIARWKDIEIEKR